MPQEQADKQKDTKFILREKARLPVAKRTSERLQKSIFFCSASIYTNNFGERYRRVESTKAKQTERVRKHPSGNDCKSNGVEVSNATEKEANATYDKEHIRFRHGKVIKSKLSTLGLN